MMSKAKENLPMEAMAENGEAAEAAANITPPPPSMTAPAAAIQRARASLLLSSLRRQAAGTLADPDTEDVVELRRRVVDLSAEICSQRRRTKRSLHLKNLEGILGFVSFCLFLLLIALE